GSDLSSTIGREVNENYALQPMPEEAFVELVLDQLPFVPKYFAYDVMLNKQGADAYLPSLSCIPVLSGVQEMMGIPQALIVDVRPAEQFRSGHTPGAINIPDGLRFETWLGSVVSPEEPFFVLVDSPEQ